jgi:hypothetical protein
MDHLTLGLYLDWFAGGFLERSQNTPVKRALQEHGSRFSVLRIIDDADQLIFADMEQPEQRQRSDQDAKGDDVFESSCAV